MAMTNPKPPPDHAPDHANLSTYKTEYLDCRRGSGIGHNWEWQGPFYKYANEIHRRAACSRCGGEKTCKRYLNGGYIATTYTPPKDYGLSGGVTVQEMWTEMLSRNKVYRNEIEAAKAAEKVTTITSIRVRRRREA